MNTLDLVTVWGFIGFITLLGILIATIRMASGVGSVERWVGDISVRLAELEAKHKLRTHSDDYIRRRNHEEL